MGTTGVTFPRFSAGWLFTAGFVVCGRLGGTELGGCLAGMGAPSLSLTASQWTISTPTGLRAVVCVAFRGCVCSLGKYVSR